MSPFFLISCSPKGDEPDRIVAHRPHDRDLSPLQRAYRHPSFFALSHRGIAVALASKDEVGIEEIEPVLREIAQPLALIPLEPHGIM
jgi:hypothetical protein